MNTKNLPGYTLIEIMIALVISSILMYGVITIMASSKRTYALQDELAKLQDNARFAIDDLTYTIRMTGFKGCAGRNYTSANPFLMCNPNTNIKVIDGRNDEPIRDIKDNYTQPSTWSDAQKYPPSDTLIVRFMNSSINFDLSATGPCGYNSVGQYSPAVLNLKTNNICLSGNVPPVGTQVVVMDCGARSLATVGTCATTSGSCITLKTVKTDAVQDFKRPIDIFPCTSSTGSSTLYQVRSYPDASLGPSVRSFGLFREDADNPQFREPFIEGVENLQVRYGVDNGGSITYVSNITNVATGSIVSVRITLLMRTAHPRFDLGDSTDKPFTLDPDLKDYNPSEHQEEKNYRHRLFTTTVYLRNAQY